jgi:Fe2+ or Zn2+ uptake regulation protein
VTTKEDKKLTALLRERSLRATPQRLQVLGLLARAKKPLSIPELQEKAGKQQIDSVTLYRSLETLVENSLARPVDLRHGHVDYEFVGDDKHHHHIVCEKCGRIEDIDWCPEKDFEKKIVKHAKHFSRLTDHSLEFLGLCTSCA